MKILESCMVSGRKETAIAAIAIIASTVQVHRLSAVPLAGQVHSQAQGLDSAHAESSKPYG